MEIEKNFFTESVLPLFSNVGKDTEIEASLYARGARGQTVPIDRGCFTALLAQLISRSEFQLQKEIDMLDISWDVYRCSINGLGAINKYCKTNNFDLSNTVVITKQKTSTPVVFAEYPLKLRSSLENHVSDPREILKNMAVKKTYRLKKRFSFLHKTTTRIDLTIVRQSTTTKKYSKTNIEMIKEAFEIEVEYKIGRAHV